MGKAKLTDKQEQFCLEYVVDFNATRAYKAAGYTAQGNAAEVNASKLLRNTKVAKRIKELKVPRQDAPKNLREKLLQRLEEIAFTNIDEFMENEYYEDEQTGEKVFYRRKIKENLFESDKLAAVAGLKPSLHGTELKMKDQLKAIEMLSRHIGLFNDDTTQKPETNNFDFSNLSSEKLRKIKEILSDPES